MRRKKRPYAPGFMILVGLVCLLPFIGLGNKAKEEQSLSSIANLADKDLLLTNAVQTKQPAVQEEVKIEPAVSKKEPPPPTQIKTKEKLSDRQKVKITRHIVRKGENLSTISKQYGINIDSIVGSNNLRGNSLFPGQKLEIPNQKGILYRVRSGQSLWDIARLYKTPLKEITRHNNLASNQIKPGQVLFLPKANLLYEQRIQLVSYSPSKRFVAPVKGRISSGFGYRTHPIYQRVMFHAGLDLVAPYGSKIRAAASGKVIFSGWEGGYGQLVIIKHPNGYTTKYGHNKRNLVRTGQYVKQYQGIALLGNTGTSTGPHVHFEICKNGKPVNPTRYIR